MKNFILLLVSIICFTNINAQTTVIPGYSFEMALINLGLDSGPVDGVVLTANIDTLDSLDLFSKNIYNLTGIEDFTALTYLRVNNNFISSLDVTQNVNLIYLICSDNQLTALNVTQNTNLDELLCSSNQITNLDVTQNISLTNLSCSFNLINTIDITQNTNLTAIGFAGNPINIINLTQNSLLTSIYGNGTQINNLDISLNTLVETFNFAGTPINQLNVKNGNNINLLNFNVVNSPNLTCIQVDDSAWAAANWMSIDAQSYFSENCSVGINDVIDDELIQIYPNPANEILNIDITKKHNNQTLKIVDVTGKIVLTKTLFKEEKNTVQLTNLPQGYYSVIVYSDLGIVFAKKLIVTH